MDKNDEFEKRISENEKNIEVLQENIGMVNVFKEIIQVTKETNKFNIIIIVILSILIVLLVLSMFFNQRDFTKYREDSISKSEIVEMFESLQ